MHLPDPAVWDEPAMRACLAVRDVAGIFTLLKARGFAQRQLAQLTGMSQSEVSEIMNGRQVQAYDVLGRVAEGLGAPRAYMGLAYDETVLDTTAEEVDEDVKRRALFAVATTALVGSPVLGEVLHLPVRPPQPTPLPSRLSAADVRAMQKLTAGLRGVARAHGGCADVVTAVVNRSRALMDVPADDHIHAAMGSTLANLHTMAGWTCVDSGLHDQARACFAHAMELSKIAGDGGEMASAFRHAGIQMSDTGAHNDALKAFQLGLMGADAATPLGPLHGSIAWRYALMGHKDLALSALAKAREQPLTDPFEVAEMDYLSACVYAEL
ncbi:MAG: helix-turn-helix domain-containing protein [Candidatus Acidiferrales bacterium]